MSRAPLVILLDACVLYPAPLRDLLMRLAVNEIIRVRWTEQIHAEWINALLRERSDLDSQKLERTKALMNQHAADCLVENYEHHIESLALPDPDDRHVLAAAIESEAQAIVTWNISDFPQFVLAEHGLQVWTPDQFLMLLLAENREGSHSCHARAQGKPPQSPEIRGRISRYLEATGPCRNNRDP